MNSNIQLNLSHFPVALKENSSEVVQPFLMGCGTKEPKITQLCLTAIQRLMSHEVVSEVSTMRLVLLHRCVHTKKKRLLHPMKVKMLKKKSNKERKKCI